MDSSLQSRSPDNSDVKPSFRKPSNDAASRKYRRRSPIRESASSSPSGSPNHDRGYTPPFSREETTSMYDGRRKPKNGSDDRRKIRDERDLGRDSTRNHSNKSSGNSHNYRRQDDYGKHSRHAVEEDRKYERFSSSSGRDSRDTIRDGDRDSSRDNWRSSDKYSRDGGLKSKDKDRETAAQEYHHRKDRDLSPERVRDRNRVREGARDDRRDHRKNVNTSANYIKDGHRVVNRDLDGWKEDETRRKNKDREYEKRKERYDREEKVHDAQNDRRSSLTQKERDEKTVHTKDKTTESPPKKLKLSQSEKAAGDGQPSKSTMIVGDDKPSLSSKQVQEPVAKGILGANHTTVTEAEVANDLSAAKVAAMKAAELVNKNLVGGSYLSTDQKKKLLWGNKNTSTEESGSRWNTMLFSDRERQEKFNKLMGVKGEAKPELKPNSEDGIDLRAEKEKELQVDLEKQYTAGLRRRDGRTVGLGL